MQVDIFKSDKKKSKFLIVPAGTKISDGLLSSAGEDFQSVTLFKDNVTLQKGIIALNSDEAKSDIESKGYHIVVASISFDAS